MRDVGGWSDLFILKKLQKEMGVFDLCRIIRRELAQGVAEESIYYEEVIVVLIS